MSQNQSILLKSCHYANISALWWECPVSYMGSYRSLRPQLGSFGEWGIFNGEVLKCFLTILRPVEMYHMHRNIF